MAWLKRTVVRDQRPRDRVRLGTAQADHADPAAAGWGCFGDDGIGGGKHGSEKTAESAEGAEKRFISATDYLRAEIITVLENASPTLSVVAPGTSATAMCTMRRSYGFSGPSC
jgi:hypothetical protein